jgi:5-methylcytosine-specific restriction endonuclease McrA
MRNGLTCSDAGKLGYLKSVETRERKKKERIEQYNSDPKLCKYCSSKLSYEDKEKIFCNSSCAASYNNKGIKRHKSEDVYCLKCGAVVKKNASKFCSHDCRIDHQWQESKERIEAGEIVGHRRFKRYLIKTRGHKCEKCGGTEWMGKPMPLVMDHINGNPEDWRLENLRLICCNCDAQTDTYKGRNKGNGRAYRRKRYAEGKSY